jgi:hypothetical protein
VATKPLEGRVRAEPSVRRIERQQMRKRPRIRNVVDGDHVELAVGKGAPDERTADPAEPSPPEPTMKRCQLATYLPDGTTTTGQWA